MHPLGAPDGGFTQIRNRALRDMALGAGAAEVLRYQGAPLTDAQLQEPAFLQARQACD